MEKLPNSSLKNSHSSPHNEMLIRCQAQPAQNRALGLSIPSLRFQDVSGYAWHTRVRYLGFSPATFSKGGAGQEIGLFYHLYFILGWPGEGLPYSLTSWAELLIYPAYMYGVAGAPQRSKPPSILWSMQGPPRIWRREHRPRGLH